MSDESEKADEDAVNEDAKKPDEEKAEEAKAESEEAESEEKAESSEEKAEPEGKAEPGEKAEPEEKADEPEAKPDEPEAKPDEPEAKPDEPEVVTPEGAGEVAGEPMTAPNIDHIDPHVQTELAAAGAVVGDPVEAEASPSVHLGTLVEFESEESLMEACAKVRDAGWTDWDAHTPYPVHGLDGAMGIKPTILPWIVLGGGLTGCMAGLILQCYTNGIELPFSLSDTLIDPLLPSGYPYVTSGKPIFSIPANIPVMFELTILLSAFGAFFGMWGLNQLPRFWHPVFQSERFKRATDDRFFISLEARDPLFHPDKARAFAESLGGSHVEDLMGEEG